MPEPRRRRAWALDYWSIGQRGDWVSVVCYLVDLRARGVSLRWLHDDCEEPRRNGPWRDDLGRPRRPGARWPGQGCEGCWLALVEEVGGRGA